jgi:hypothetical protein
MIFILILLTLNFAQAQEIEITTNNVQVFARVKNCIDFYLCNPYEETLKVDNDFYRWKAQFKGPLANIQTAFQECSVGNINFEITVRDEFGVVAKDFSIPRTSFSKQTEQYLLPMELYSRTYEGLKAKEKLIQTLLESKDPLPAMKSTTFEMEYPLGDYHLNAYGLGPNVLGLTNHLKKIVVYDLDKWDGSVCRFYEVMRHETQHVRNRRKQLACKGNHHFRFGNNDERSTYLNDLVFLRRFCPEEKALYQNVEAMLLNMYQNKKLQPCGVSEESGGDVMGDNKASQPKHTHSNSSRYKKYRRILKDVPERKNPSGLH